MAVDQVLNKLYSLGIKITVVDDKLKVQSTKDKIPSNIVELIKANKEELIRFFRKSSEKNYTIQIGCSEKKDSWKLSSSQKRQYLLQHINNKSTAYNMPNFISLGVDVDKDKIECIFKELISRHESFRTSFEMRDSEIIQRIHEKVEFELKYFKTEKNKKDYFKYKFIQAFDLSQVPLLRVMLLNVKNEGYLLMVDMHHIICDGISHAILEKEFNLLYSGEKLKPLRVQYTDYCDWQKSIAQQEHFKKQEAFWLSTYSDEVQLLNLPTDFSRPPHQNFEGGLITFSLSKEETEILKEVADNNGLTLYMILLSVYVILLSKLSGQSNIIVGTPVSGRSHTDLEKIVGIFVNTLALRIELNRNSTLRQVFTVIKQTVLNSFDNQDYQFEDLVEKLSINRDTSRNPIFDVMFNMLNYAEDTKELFDQSDDKNNHLSSISKFDLTLTAVDYREQLMLSFNYYKRLFKKETIEKYIESFKQIVNQLPHKLDDKLSTIEIISDDERQQLLYNLNNTFKTYKNQKPIHQIIEEQALIIPNSIAIVSGDKNFTYSELNRRSKNLAKCLKNKGVKKNSVVSLFFESSIEMLISILGVLRSGATYLPINPELPEDRIKYMIYDSGSNIVLTHSLVNLNGYKGVNIINVEEIKSSEDNPELNEIDCYSDSAYVIYTSGTTGKPKGVILNHENLINYFNWFREISQLGKNDCTALVTSYAFDLGYTSMFSSLISGRQLHLISKDQYLSPTSLVDYIIKNKISYLKLTPSLYSLLVDEEEFSKAIKNLKLLVLGGEEINISTINKSIDLNSELKIINHYGPTEATIGCISFGINKNNISHYSERPVIGKPIHNTKVYILNEDNQVQPFGVSGELCISGNGLAGGYLNNPDLTSEKFIDSPFHKEEKLYKTGDLACRLPNGDIEFLGRIDDQIKIRGYRIELSEIEGSLRKHKYVKECAVIAKERSNDKYLCAYTETLREISVDELKNYLSLLLPDYMIPAFFINLEKIPRTPNGKINRKVLPEPEIEIREYIPPKNDIERKFIKIWSEVLDITKDKISVETNFFDLGGHSLKAIILCSAVYKEFNVKISIRDVFNNMDIKSLAKLIVNKDTSELNKLKNTEKKEYYELSYNQKRIWFLNQFNLDSDAYNIGGAISINNLKSINDIYKTIRLVLNSNVSLRSGFKVYNGEPIQVVYSIEEIEIDELVLDLRQDSDFEDKLLAFYNYSFDLENPPLVRFILYNTDNNNAILAVIMHHIITDGWSMGLLKNEFDNYYSQVINGNSLATNKRNDYIDYVYWQSAYINKKSKEARNFWIKEISKPIEIVDLPKDYTNTGDARTGSIYNFILAKEQLDKFEVLKKQLNCSSFTLLFSAYLYLLYKISGNRNISSFIINAGRDHPSTFSIIGFFVNAVLFNIELDENLTYESFIKEVQNKSYQVFEHQHYPLEKLFEETRTKYPEIPVSFNMLNHKEQQIIGEFNGNENSNNSYNQDVKFELELYVRENKSTLGFQFAYNEKYFSKETIKYLAGNYLEIVDSMIINSESSFLGFLNSKKKLKLF